MRLGPWEIALIAMFVVVLFGARKIPEIMRGLGLGIKEFKSGMRDENQDKKSQADKTESTEKTPTEGEQKDETK